MNKYFVKTFWCAMNYADSEKINMIFTLSSFWLAKNMEDSDIVVFNTCSVRKKWEDKVFSAIRNLKMNFPNIIVGITWCMVRKTGMNNKYLNSYKRDRTKAKKIILTTNNDDILNNDDMLFPRLGDNLDFAIRIEDIKYLPIILSNIKNTHIWNDYMFDDYLKLKQLRTNKYSATIIIQTWCDNYCSFCIVPYTRGKELSRSIDDIYNEALNAVNNWAKEITLVWQNVNSYWKQFVSSKYWNVDKWNWNINQDFKSPFRQLLEKLNTIDWLDRIRFTSSNPHDMTKDILDAHFELDKMCNYLHIALQSWSNTMLKNMHRRHKYEDFLYIVNYLRKKDPEFSISTDIIVWFPWETDDMFNKTLKAYDELDLDFAFNARYSERKWTMASKNYQDDINSKIKSDRWHNLNNKLLENVIRRNSTMIWKKYLILIDKEKNNLLYWRTRNFKEVVINKQDNIKIWDLVNIEIIKIERFKIIWSLV